MGHAPAKGGRRPPGGAVGDGGRALWWSGDIGRRGRRPDGGVVGLETDGGWIATGEDG